MPDTIRARLLLLMLTVLLPALTAALLIIARTDESEHAGLATVERDSRNLIYRADIVQMGALLAYLSDHCCQSAGCAPSSAGGAALRRQPC